MTDYKLLTAPGHAPLSRQEQRRAAAGGRRRLLVNSGPALRLPPGVLPFALVACGIASAALAQAPPLKPHEYCAVCHKEIVEDFLSHPHYKAGMECNTCHGDSVGHRTSEGHEAPDKIAAANEIPALCGNCHRGGGARPILAEYLESRHGKLVMAESKTRAPHCGTCHGVHNVRGPSAMELQCRRCHAQLPPRCSGSPARAAALRCAGCHFPHVFLAQGGSGKRAPETVRRSP